MTRSARWRPWAAALLTAVVALGGPAAAAGPDKEPKPRPGGPKAERPPAEPAPTELVTEGVTRVFPEPARVPGAGVRVFCFQSTCTPVPVPYLECDDFSTTPATCRPDVYVVQVLRARLTSQGRPLESRRVVFRYGPGEQQVCEDSTDVDGRAVCLGLRGDASLVLGEPTATWTVTYAGDAATRPSAATGRMRVCIEDASVPCVPEG